MRHTRSQTRQRRSHEALITPRLSKCASCAHMHVRHAMCENCGSYRGKTVLDMKGKHAKRSTRIMKKREMIRKDTGAQEAEKAEAESK